MDDLLGLISAWGGRPLPNRFVLIALTAPGQPGPFGGMPLYVSLSRNFDAHVVRCCRRELAGAVALRVLWQPSLPLP